jgi:hypothetical protein
MNTFYEIPIFRPPDLGRQDGITGEYGDDKNKIRLLADSYEDGERGPPELGRQTLRRASWKTDGGGMTRG